MNQFQTKVTKQKQKLHSHNVKNFKKPKPKKFENKNFTSISLSGARRKAAFDINQLLFSLFSEHLPKKQIRRQQ